MARARAIVIQDDQLRIPGDALSYQGFHRWVDSAVFPETGRIDYLAGDIEVDMSPEDLFTHGTLKTEIVRSLGNVLAAGDLGDVFADSTRVTSRFAGLSAEPDVVVVLWESLRSGRVRNVPAAAKGPDRFVALEGAPDIVVEVVSDSSLGKDTKRLPPLYAKAGIPELWLIDARGKELRLQIHALKEGKYVPAKPNSQGWARSARLAMAFRLSRQRTPVGTWRYTLEQRA